MAFHAAAQEAGIAQLRASLRQAQQVVAAAQEALERLHVSGETTTHRGSYLQSLQELIGPPPERTWEQEWVRLRAEVRWRQGDTVEIDEKYVEEIESIGTWKANTKPVVEQLVSRGWSVDNAE
eukprot:5201662-Prymnesium_polylepis.1